VRMLFKIRNLKRIAINMPDQINTSYSHVTLKRYYSNVFCVKCLDSLVDNSYSLLRQKKGRYMTSKGTGKHGKPELRNLQNRNSRDYVKCVGLRAFDAS
jgi:hypothetical protein